MHEELLGAAVPRHEWSYSAGRRGINFVTVYERPGGAQIYMSWVDDDGRHDQTVEAVIGHPVTDRELAKRIADEVSKAQEAKANARAGEAIFGYNPDRTLAELLDRMHEVRGDGWSESYTRDQRRFKRFWLGKLGSGIRLVDLSPAWVERVAKAEAKERAWSARTLQSYLRYLVDALTFAQKKLKWITERHNLSAVDLPSAASDSKAYSEDELGVLLPALCEVDLRAGGVGEVAYATGRRLNSIRLLRLSSFPRGGDVPVLRFPGGTDKARRSGTAVLTPQAADALARLAERPAVQATGLLFPSGDLDSVEVDREPVSRWQLIQWLHEAEERAGIEHVSGRAYHGIKRRVATMANDRRAMSKQSGTTEQTLRRVYEQDDLAPKKALADYLASRREPDEE